MSSEQPGPSSHFFVSQRLRLHYVDWGNSAAPPLVLVHGGRDHARSWDWVAQDLRRDHHVIAPDLRGHGDSAWAIGSLYHIAEFVIDLAQLIDAIGQDKVILVAHSMGSAICAQYAGANPDRVSKLVAIEGIDLPTWIRERFDELPASQRVALAIESAQKQASRMPRRYPTIDAAAQRMHEANAFLTVEQARHLTEHGVARNEDGSYSWKFDDYARGPKMFRMPDEEVAELVSQIQCPVLLIRGTESDAPDPSETGLLGRIPDARAVAVEGAGHWVHHDRLDEVLRLVRSFLKEGT
jgi:pimeloyl-ACP methyl ester carboxylesterase